VSCGFPPVTTALSPAKIKLTIAAAVMVQHWRARLRPDVGVAFSPMKNWCDVRTGIEDEECGLSASMSAVLSRTLCSRTPKAP
jgi:hypothetical protein